MAKGYRGYRTAESYLSRDPERRARQIQNLTQYRGKARAIDSNAPAAIRTPDKYTDDCIGFIEDYRLGGYRAYIYA